MTEDFIQKLMVSKKIMEKSDGIPRNTNGTGMLNVNEMSLPSAPDLYTANPVNGTYNIPQESRLPRRGCFPRRRAILCL